MPDPDAGSRRALPLPLAWLAVPLVLGCRAGPALAHRPGATVLLACAAIAGALALACVLARDRPVRAPLVTALVATCALLAGAARGGGRSVVEPDSVAAWTASGADAALRRHPLLVSGRPTGLVHRYRLPAGELVHCAIALSGARILGREVPLHGEVVLWADPEAAPQLRKGAVRAWVRWRRGETPANPGSRPREPAVSLLATSPVLLEAMGGPPSAGRRLRLRLADGLDRAFGERPLGRGLARALVLGDRSDLDREMVRALRASGTAHVLAVSGLHVALVTGLLLSGAERLGARPRPAAAAAVTAAWCFAATAGFGVPVTRAAILVTAFGIGRLMRRRVEAWNALCLAGAGCVLLHPESALRSGFNLSFAATAGLLAVRPRLAEVLPTARSRAGHAARSGAAASLAAWASVVPITASAFGTINPLAPLANLVAVPVAGVATAASLGTALLALGRPSTAAPLAGLVDLCARGLVATGDATAWSSVTVAAPPAAALAGWATGLALWSLAADPRWRAAGALALVAGAAGLTAGGSGWPEGQVARVTVLDVGQGSAALVEIGRRAGRAPWRALVDGGGRPGSARDVGIAVVAPALRALGIARLDAVVLSHGDVDHAGGLPGVIRLFRPRAVVHGPGDETTALGELRRAADEVGARRTLTARGGRLGPPDGAAELVVSWPPREADRRRGLSRNDLSLVLRLVRRTDGEGLALLPGDLEAEGERRLVAGAQARACLLVVGHHGSRSSSTPGFLRAVDPALAIASAGRSSRFGHPHPEVLRTLEERGVTTTVTARSGAVTVRFGGGALHELSGRLGPPTLTCRCPRDRP